MTHNFGVYWTQATTENSGKWQSVEKSRGNYEWGDTDKAYDFAKRNGILFKFAPVICGSSKPNFWDGLSDDDRKEAIVRWMEAIGAHYPKIDLIEVVNEPFHSVFPDNDAFGGSGRTGYDWIVWCFSQARIAFPGVPLLINEYGIINDPPLARQYIEIIKILQWRGLIDGIGIQCHRYNLLPTTPAAMKPVLDLLAETGLPIHVTGFDLDGDTPEIQEQRYQTYFPPLWEHPAVKGITLWGYFTGSVGIVDWSGERLAVKWLRGYVQSTDV